MGVERGVILHRARGQKKSGIQLSLTLNNS
jgi:hypothetical protein